MHLENEMDNQGSITIQIKMDEYRGLESALAARISEVAKELDKHNGQAETLQKELNVVLAYVNQDNEVHFVPDLINEEIT